MVDNVCVKFGDPSCIGFWDIVCKNKRTDTQTPLKTLPTGLATAWVTRMLQLTCQFPTHLLPFRSWQLHELLYDLLVTLTS